MKSAPPHFLVHRGSASSRHLSRSRRAGADGSSSERCSLRADALTVPRHVCKATECGRYAGRPWHPATLRKPPEQPALPRRCSAISHGVLVSVTVARSCARRPPCAGRIHPRPIRQCGCRSASVRRSLSRADQLGFIPASSRRSATQDRTLRVTGCESPKAVPTDHPPCGCPSTH